MRFISCSPVRVCDVFTNASLAFSLVEAFIFDDGLIPSPLVRGFYILKMDVPGVSLRCTPGFNSAAPPAL